MQGSKPLFCSISFATLRPGDTVQYEHDRDFPFGLEDPNTKRQATEQENKVNLRSTCIERLSPVVLHSTGKMRLSIMPHGLRIEFCNLRYAPPVYRIRCSAVGTVDPSWRNLVHYYRSNKEHIMR